MSAIGVGVRAALMTAGGLGAGAFAAFAGVAAGEQEGGGADEQGKEFDLFHAFFWFSGCVGASLGSGGG